MQPTTHIENDIVKIFIIHFGHSDGCRRVGGVGCVSFINDVVYIMAYAVLWAVYCVGKKLYKAI